MGKPTTTDRAAPALIECGGLFCVEVGDYVLATKYGDGDPQDHWAVGFYAGATAPHYDPPRFDVVDGEGRQFRGNGFRRVEKISRERGAWMLKHARDIELSGMSVWYFATCPMDDPQNVKAWRGAMQKTNESTDNEK